MNPKRRDEFNRWYDSRQVTQWDNWAELTAYCDQDVNVLCEALNVYSNEMLALNGIEPLRSVTIAGYALKVFCASHMVDGTIAVLNRDEYTFARRAFRGGRTEVFRLDREWTPEEIARAVFGRYQDIVSLYPTVQFFDWLPCGAPITVLYAEGEMPDIESVFGIIECDVSCPDDLLHPVLSTHENGKLVSSLHSKQKECFTSVELQQAVALGYQVTRVSRIDHYEKSNTVFKSYIELFMKIKMEAGDAITDESELAEVQRTMGFTPDFAAGPNPGRKSIAKLMLNSLWGKFGQNVDNGESQWCKPAAWYKLLHRLKLGEVVIHRCDIAGDWVFTKWNLTSDSENVTLMNTNVALCAFVTGNARMRL